MKYYKLLLITLVTCILLILESIDKRLDGLLFVLPGFSFPVGIIVAIRPKLNVIRSISLIILSLAIWYGCVVLAANLVGLTIDLSTNNFITASIIDGTIIGFPGLLGGLLMYLLVGLITRIKHFNYKLFYGTLIAGFISAFIGGIFIPYLADLSSPFGNELSFSSKVFPVILFWQLSVGYFILKNYTSINS